MDMGMGEDVDVSGKDVSEGDGVDGVGDEEDGVDGERYEEWDEDEDVYRVGRRMSGMGCVIVDRVGSRVGDMVCGGDEQAEVSRRC